MKKRIIIPTSLFFIFPYLTRAQEGQILSKDSIQCAEFSIVIDKFEVADTSKIYVCCGVTFEDAILPCKILNKVNYESFSGQSDEVFNPDENGFLLTELLVPIKNKIAKLKEVTVIDSSTFWFSNKGLITIKKRKYMITDDGVIFLEIEPLK